MNATASADSQLGVKLLAVVLGLWLVMRSVVKDSTGRTLIDHILNRKQSESPLLNLNLAGAGASLATAGQILAGGVANPFPGGWTPGRLDQGYDGTFRGNIVAPVSGTVTYASDSFSNWGGYMNLKADAPIPGLGTDTLYFAEGLHPLVRAGTRVSAGTPIASASGQGPQAQGRAGLIEWGPAKSGGMGSPSDPIQQGAQEVFRFAAWAESALHLAKPAETSNAGSF